MGERLLRAALAHDPTQLVVSGVYDPEPSAQRRLTDELPQIVLHPTLEALYDASDCVHIASPPDYHLPQLKAACEAGLAVLCEKPLAIDRQAAHSLVAQLDQHNARTAVNFPFASSFAVDQLNDWRQSGVTGAVESIEIDIGFAAWPRPWQLDAKHWLDRRAQGGFTREVVSHFLFLSERQVGSIALLEHSVSFPDDERSETHVNASLSSTLNDKDVPINLNGRVGFTDKPDHNIWQLNGTDGAIRLRDWAIAEQQVTDAQGKRVWCEAPDSQSNETLRPLVLRRQLDKVVALTLGQPHNLASLKEALSVQHLVEAILN